MLYADGKGRYDREYGELWKALVPRSGQAETVQGELVRAIGRLAGECYRNGNGNWGPSFEALIGHLRRWLVDPSVFGPAVIRELHDDLTDVLAIGRDVTRFDFPNGEDVYDRITDRVVEWCREHPDSIPHVPNLDLRV